MNKLLKQLKKQIEIDQNKSYEVRKTGFVWDIENFKAKDIVTAIEALIDYVEYQEDADKQMLEDAVTEIADGLVNLHNAERVDWLADSYNNADYCDEAMREYGVDDQGIYAIIGMGQYKMWSDLLYVIVEKLEDRSEKCQ